MTQECRVGVHDNCLGDCECTCHDWQQSDPLDHIAAGRQDISLKEGRVYDRERLIDSPLFKQQGRLF